MYMPMLKNRVNGCYGNHAFFHSANIYLYEQNISGVPMNNFAPIKIILGHKVGQISSRNTTVVFLLLFFFSVFFIYVFINIHEYTN